MDIKTLGSRLEAIEQALQWRDNVPSSEQFQFQEKLVNLRREYKRIRFAIEERPSVAAFGESQMGKSYLISAMLSTPDTPFSVTDGEHSYNFIDEINPSLPNSTIEATGVITRFSIRPSDAPKSYLRARLLSVSDIILVLCEAYYNQVDYSHEKIIDDETINKRLRRIHLNPISKSIPFITEDDLLDIIEYLKTSSIQKKCHPILSSELFEFLLNNLNKIGQEDLLSLIRLLWNENPDINRLLDDLISTYQLLDYRQTVYVEFVSVLKRQGSLLDVARLDEMYDDSDNTGGNFMRDVNVIKDKNSGSAISIPKSFFSALIAELTFTLPAAVVGERDFLNHTDILDFPGARRPEQIKEDKLSEGKNLSTILRRGKVSYFFNKYSAAKRITALLFCHNNNQSAESTIGGVLGDWINTNIGNTAAQRQEFIDSAGMSPLFIISTWFNKDLEYQNEMIGDKDRLNERWQRRFRTVLEKEVLRSVGDPEHWFNHWIGKEQHEPFSNIFMLRDFKYSRTIFRGYNPETGHAEEEPINNEKYPKFLEDLRLSFVGNSFVREHFPHPEDAWLAAATTGNDGTKPIIRSLSTLAPNVAVARDEKLLMDFNELDKRLKSILEGYYHPEDKQLQLKQAKRLVGSVCSTIDIESGKDPYFFGRLIGKLMISETELYELIHRQILGAELPRPSTDGATQIYINARLDSSVSREENVERLCDYLGCDNEEECRQMLALQGVDHDKLLNHDIALSSIEEQLVQIVEKQWHDEFLAKRCSQDLRDNLPSIDVVISKLWTLYRLCGMHDALVNNVGKILRDLTNEACVGVIADLLTMELNTFVNTFGYNQLPEDKRENILSLNDKLRLGLDKQLLLDKTDNNKKGLELLDLLEKRHDGNQRDALMLFPQFFKKAQWQQKLRIGYYIACDLPDFDPVANAKLASIMAILK